MHQTCKTGGKHEGFFWLLNSVRSGLQQRGYHVDVLPAAVVTMCASNHRQIFKASGFDQQLTAATAAFALEQDAWLCFFDLIKVARRSSLNFVLDI